MEAPPLLSPERGMNHQVVPPPSVRGTLKDDALYLASVLRDRLPKSSMSGKARGLLSMSLSRGELDEFLVAFFSDPANLLFAKEKVHHLDDGTSTVHACRSLMKAGHRHDELRYPRTVPA